MIPLRLESLKQTSADRFLLTFDDGTVLRSTLNAVTDFRMFSGKEMTQEEYDIFVSANYDSLARQTAITIISHRPMLSVREMNDKLLQKGIPSERAENCCQWLVEKGFLNDAVYANAVVRHCYSKGYGSSRIKSELIRRGVSREYWENALSQFTADDCFENIKKYISSHLKDQSDQTQIRKVSNALVRRGFSWSQIRSVLSEMGEDPEFTEEY